MGSFDKIRYSGFLRLGKKNPAERFDGIKNFYFCTAGICFRLLPASLTDLRISVSD